MGGDFRGDQHNREAGGIMSRYRFKRSDHYLDWLDNNMVCEHCKKREVIKFPLSFAEVKKKMEKFKQEHKGCKPQH